MISKLFLGFTKHDRLWLTRITLCALLFSMLILFFGYYGDISIYNENTRKSMVERKVFKRFLDQDYGEYNTVFGNKIDVINKYFDKKVVDNDHSEWASSIMINEDSSVENAIKNEASNIEKNVQQKLMNWFQLMGDKEIDVNGNMHIQNIYTII